MFRIDYEAEYAAIIDTLEGGHALFNPRFINASVNLVRMIENKEYIKLIKYREKLIEKNLVSQEKAKALRENSTLRFLYLCSLHDSIIEEITIDKRNSCMLFRISADVGRFPFKSYKGFQQYALYDKLEENFDIEVGMQKICLLLTGINVDEKLIREINTYEGKYIVNIYNICVDEKFKLTIELDTYDNERGKRFQLEIEFDKIYVYEE